jgi:hypothetical protein
MIALESFPTDLFSSFPAAGNMILITELIPKLQTPTKESKSIYAFGERAVLINKKEDGCWIAEIAMGVNDWGNGVASRWFKDGTRIILQEEDFKEYDN